MMDHSFWKGFGAAVMLMLALWVAGNILVDRFIGCFGPQGCI